MIFVAVTAGTVALFLATAWLCRSPWCEARKYYQRLGRLTPKEMPAYLNRLLARSVSPRGQQILNALARRMAKAPDSTRARLAEIVLVTAPLFGLLKTRGFGLDSETRRQIAEILDARVRALDVLAEREGGELARMADRVSRQDRLWAGFLRAESPAHLTVLHDEIAALEQGSGELLDRPHFLKADFLEDLRRLLEGLEPLERLSRGDDRALVLSQALTRSLDMQEQTVRRSSELPSFGLLIGGMALDSMRQIFSAGLEDLNQRAALEVALRSRRLTVRREAVVVLEIKNVGRGYARNLDVELAADPSVVSVPRPRQRLVSLLRSQSAQVKFAIEPLRGARVRLDFKITWTEFDHQRRDHRFGEVVELCRYQEPAVFRPLLPNPYVVGRPLLDSDLFFGREDLFARLRASFQGAEQDNVVVLIGQRRMGKTSILKRLHLHLPESYVPALVDLQGLLGSGEPAFFRTVAGQVADELLERGVTVAEPRPEEFEDHPGLLFRRRFLPAVREALGDRRLLLVFDELEVLEERIRDGALTPQILPYLRSLLQHEDGLSFMLAGSQRLEELAADYWGVLFNLAIHFEVGHLTQADVGALLVEPTGESFEIDALALENIYRTTGGHPHFSQLVARELVDFCNRSRISYVTVQDTSRVIDAVVEKGQLHIAHLWEEASHDERLLLLATRSLLEREGLASVPAVYRHLGERRVEAGDLAAAMRRLERREILAEEAGQLSFRIGLLRRWLDRHQDLESFVAEEGAQP